MSSTAVPVPQAPQARGLCLQRRHRQGYRRSSAAGMVPVGGSDVDLGARAWQLGGTVTLPPACARQGSRGSATLRHGTPA